MWQYESHWSWHGFKPHNVCMEPEVFHLLIRASLYVNLCGRSLIYSNDVAQEDYFTLFLMFYCIC